MQVSQKAALRRSSSASLQGGANKSPASFSVLDFASQAASFPKLRRLLGKGLAGDVVVAYKPRRKRYALHTGDMGMNSILDFTMNVLSGDEPLSSVEEDLL
eukprot:jgi/Mesvir1/9561/Mv05818-RA.1